VKARALVGALAVGVALSGGMMGTPIVSAAPSQHSDETSLGLSCSWLTEEGGTVFFGAQSFGDAAGSFLFVESDEGLLLEGWEGSAQFDGSTVTASVEVTDVTTDPPTAAGTATVSASRTPDGAPDVITVDDRIGNEITKGTETHQTYAVSDVEVRVPGYTIVPDPYACASTDVTFDVRTNAPRGMVRTHSEYFSPICEVDDLPTLVLLGGALPTPEIEVVMDGSPMLKASGTVPLLAGAGSVTLPLVVAETGDQVDEITIDLTLDKLSGREHESFTMDGATERIAVHTYEAQLTLTTSTGTRTAACTAWDVSTHTIIRPQRDV
jgi:hypothetical protein